jgi:putative phosphotransacetylase
MGSEAPITRALVEQVVREVVLRRLAPRPGGPGLGAAPALQVHASARHMHLSREDLDRLFGKGYELQPLRELYQAGNFAAKETVTLVGPRSRLISNLRILAPLRSRSQVELAFTDTIALGLEDVPIRLSGDLDGSPGAFIMGPQGMIELKEGVIRAAIHVHMNPDEAAWYGVKQGDEMKLRVGGAAAVTFERVKVRIDKTSRLDVHMDTDEANACGLHLAWQIELTR